MGDIANLKTAHKITAEPKNGCHRLDGEISQGTYGPDPCLRFFTTRYPAAGMPGEGPDPQSGLLSLRRRGVWNNINR